MHQAPQHKSTIRRKALTIALICAFVIQPFTPIIVSADTSSTVPVGFIDSATCTSISGWTYDADNSTASIGVHLYTDDSSGHSFLTSTTANIARADVNSSQGVTGDHGFSFATPDVFKDGQPHLVYVYGIDSNGGTNSLLSNSPSQISGCAPVVNTAPTSPGVTPPTSVVVNTSVAFSAVSTDPQGDQISYGFDWNNDGIVAVGDYTTPYVASGLSGSINHTFDTVGTHIIRVFARDAFLSESAATTLQVSVSAASGGTVIVVPPTSPVFISTFNISPTTIQSGQTALITWSAASNATLCVASGDWSGYQSLSNTFNVGAQNFAITTNKTYILQCGNGTASTTQSVNLTINPVTTGGGGGGGGTPLIGLVSGFSAMPNPVLSGVGSTLSWSSTNATLCVASGGTPSGTWTGNQLIAGNYTIAPVTVTVSTTVIYSIACGNALGTTSRDVSFTVNPIVAPTVIDFTVSPLTGLVTSESGGTASFEIALASAPTANVILPILSSNFTEGTTSVTSRIFTPSNWNLPQSVVITGQEDAATDGPISYFVRVGASISTDIAWNNLPAKTVGVTNTDNEPTTVVVVPATGGSTSGGSRGGGGGGRGPCYGFGCKPVVVAATTTIPVVITQVPVIKVLTPSNPELVCPTTNFITSFMRVGIDNNPNEVRKLQYFLNTYEGANIVVDGDFNGQTEAAVMDMQVAHSKEILAPWGVTVPTGIVYITTARYINKVFCSQNPTYTGNESLKDIIDSSVIDKPVDNSAEFEGVIGQAASSSPMLSNIAGVFGAMTQGIGNLIKDIPWYQILILTLIIMGSWFIIAIAFKKDITEEELHMSLIRGSAALAIGTVLNVLNTLSFILNPIWFTDKAEFGLGWLLALDIINLFAFILICLTILVTLYERVVRKSIN